jgi:hypothetical protein
MATADERLALIRAKVERAEKHINDLDVALRTFLDSNPYLVARKPHPEGSDLMVYWLSSARPIPPLISIIAGDTLANLRGALDHLAFQLAWLNGARDKRILRDTCFPIFDDAASYKSGAKGKIQGMSEAAKERINACAPYKGGDDALWRLHRLNNIDKHRLLITVCMFFGSVSSEHAHYISPSHNAWKPLKAGDVLTVLPTEYVKDENLHFTFEIAFNELGVAECEPVPKTLRQMAQVVGDTVDSFETLLA